MSLKIDPKAKEAAAREGRKLLQFTLRYPNGKVAMEFAGMFPTEEVEQAFSDWWLMYVKALPKATHDDMK